MYIQIPSLEHSQRWVKREMWKSRESDIFVSVSGQMQNQMNQKLKGNISNFQHGT